MTGSGTAIDPYIIWTATDLQNMSLDLGAYYELGGNIDASATAGWDGGAGFTPVGASGTPFTGHFDGRGYAITALAINRASAYQALFGYTDGAAITNVTLATPSVVATGKNFVGALVGCGDGTTITDIAVTAATVTGKYYVGAVCGYVGGTLSGLSSSGTITGTMRVGGIAGDSYGCAATDCVSSCVVNGGLIAGGLFGYIELSSLATSRATGAVAATGAGWAGGLVGECEQTAISRCDATGAVSGATGQLGGLIGYADLGGDYATPSLISDCYATGAVAASGAGIAGGLVGVLEYSSALKNCYSTGAVSTVGGSAGGLVGHTYVTWDGTVTASPWDITTSGQATSDGGTGKTTAEMKSLATFSALLWGIGTIWNLSPACNGGYPCLIGVNPCCPMSAAGGGDVTIARTKPSLEFMRNIEMQFDGRNYVSKTGMWVYESRFARHG